MCLQQAYFTGQRQILASARAYSVLLGILRSQGQGRNSALARKRGIVIVSAEFGPGHRNEISQTWEQLGLVRSQNESLELPLIIRHIELHLFACPEEGHRALHFSPRHIKFFWGSQQQKAEGNKMASKKNICCIFWGQNYPKDKFCSFLCRVEPSYNDLRMAETQSNFCTRLSSPFFFVPPIRIC